MRRPIRLTIAIGILLACSPGLIEAQALATGAPLRLKLGAAARQGWLRYQLGPQPLSEHSYREMSFLDRSAAVTYRVHPANERAWLITLDASSGALLDGSFRDSDYGAGTERSRSVSELRGSRTRSLGAAGGRAYTLKDAGWLEEAVVWIGIREDRRWMRIRNGVQVLPRIVDRTILDGLDSRYRTRTMGPWIGVSALGTTGGGLLELELELYLRREFSAEGEWNLREDLEQPRSFSQSGTASGVAVRLLHTRRVWRGVSLELGAELDRQAVYETSDRMYFRDRGASHEVLQHFTWGDYGLRAALSAAF